MPDYIPFPEPAFPAGAMIPPSSEGAFYPLGPAQHSAHNLHIPVPYTGRTSSRSPSPYLSNAHPPPHPPFPVAPGQEFQAVRQPSPSYYLPEQDVLDSQTHLGVSGADQLHPAYQRYPDDSNGQTYYEEHEASAVNDSHKLARSPPDPPFHSGKRPGNTERSDTGIMSRLFRKTTVDHPVKDPQMTLYRCRWPGCTVPVRSDQVGRLGGFCCDTQMWDAIHNGRAKLCRCQRVCPEDWNYCSQACANGRP